MPTEQIKTMIEEAIAAQISFGNKIGKNLWIRFRNGREPLVASPWGAVLMKARSDSMGNFNIPDPGCWGTVVLQTLGVERKWLEDFQDGFNGASAEAPSESFLLGQEMAKKYL